MGARDRNFYNKLLAAYGFPAQAARIRELYLAGRKDEAAEVVPEELLRHISLIGTEVEIRERLAAYRKAGVTHLTVAPLGETTEERCTQIKALRRFIDATESWD